VHAAAAIGLPQRFFASLRAAGLEVNEHAAPDHHHWTAQELDFGDSNPVLMTAKDAVKCQGFAQSNWYCVEARVQIPPAQAESLMLKILARIGTPAKYSQ
jgi:tetraacyldisaccharide 4'-kinase